MENKVEEALSFLIATALDKCDYAYDTEEDQEEGWKEVDKATAIVKNALKESGAIKPTRTLTHKEEKSMKAIRSNWNLQFEYPVENEEEIESLLADATAIAEDALGKFFESKNIENITFSIDWDGDSDVEEGSLLHEIGLT